MPIKYDDFHTSFSLYHFRKWEWYRLWHYTTEVFKHRGMNVILYKRTPQPPNIPRPSTTGQDTVKTVQRIAADPRVGLGVMQDPLSGEAQTAGYIVKIPIRVINENTYQNLITITAQGLVPTNQGSEYTNDLYIEPFTHFVEVRKHINHFFFQTIDLDLEITNVQNGVVYYRYQEAPQSRPLPDFVRYYEEYTPIRPIKLGYTHNLDYYLQNPNSNVRFTKRSIYIRKPEYVGIDYDFMTPGDLVVDFNRVVLLVREFTLLYSILNLPYLAIKYNTIQNNNVLGQIMSRQEQAEIADYIGTSEYDAKVKTIKDFYW